MSSELSEVTQILEAIDGGDKAAAEKLLPLVYAELRAMAARQMAREAPGQTLEPTALVHEAYLRLVGPADAARWDHRGHFFAAAAEAMRRILVEAARRKQAAKRGGGMSRADIDGDQLPQPRRPDQLLAIHEALDELAQVDSHAANLVKLRYFLNMPMEEAARSMGLSTRTAERTWTYARAWLRRHIDGE